MLIQPEPEAPFGCVNLSQLSVLERAKLACNTVKTLFPDETPASEGEKDLARDVFEALTAPDEKKQVDISALAHYPTASLRHLDRMLAEYDYELVNSAVRIREYTKNKLLIETENPDGRVRIRALELLGKIKDVGLFTDRVEITHRSRSDEELEKALHEKLEKFMGLAQRDDLPDSVQPEEAVPEEKLANVLAKIES